MLRLKDAIDEKTLVIIQRMFMQFLHSSSALYEADGEIVYSVFEGGYCNFLSRISCSNAGYCEEEALISGKWICHEDCWRISKESMDRLEPFEDECSGGVSIYAVPIIYKGKVIGSINAGVTNPPLNGGKLEDVACLFGTDSDPLKQHAHAYKRLTDEEMAIARMQIRMAALLITSLYETKVGQLEDEEKIRSQNAPLKARSLAVEEQNIQLEAELADVKLLQSVSVELLYQENNQALYEKIIDSVMLIMQSEYASMQMLHPELGKEGKLRLLAFRGFNEHASRFWKWVDAGEAGTTCGEALRTGRRSIVANVEECEFMQGTADLDTYLQTGIRAVQSTPLYSRTGKILGMISTHWNKPYQPSEHQLNLFDVLARQAADLIEHKKAEEALKDSEERYRTLFENMNEGFFLAEIVCDASGKPVDYLHLAANPALERVIGLKREEILGKTRAEVQLPPSNWIDTFGKVALTREPSTFEGFSQGLDRHFLIRAFSPKQGQFACLIQDVTELKSLEAELLCQHKKLLQTEKEKNGALQKAIETKDEFLATITHEFKTPLTVINAALQTIDGLYGHEVSDNIKKHLQRIRTNTFRQLRLVNNLLDVTKYSMGSLKLNRKNMDIVFLTKYIVKSVDVYAKQKGVSLKWSSDIEHKEIGIDEEKYERIMLNLLSNAIKFTPKGKAVFVSISSKNRRVIITVRDEGIGIPQNKQGMIFERFGQVDSTLSRQAEGSGIGLSLVKTLVEGMKGTVSVESEIGKGSIFTVVLPVTKVRNENPVKHVGNLQDSRIMQTAAIEFSDIYLD